LQTFPQLCKYVQTYKSSVKIMFMGNNTMSAGISRPQQIVEKIDKERRSDVPECRFLSGLLEHGYDAKEGRKLCR
jgi:hypothetical protein